MPSGWISADDRPLLDSITRHEGTKEYIYQQMRVGRLKAAPGCDFDACLQAALWPVYLDSKGLPTVGVGHLINGREAYDPYAGMSDAQVWHQLAEDVTEHLQSARQITQSRGMEPAIRGNLVVQRFMAELCFNIGKGNYLKFKNGLLKLASAVNGDHQFSYAQAADEHLDSKWAQEVGHRAVEMCDTLRALD